ncbi:MAG TPA: hypothetical protein VK674_02480 [Candidatus Limnocylindria bacterium]|nr:hypothetical protein [Candidatus Limnocylindria bacterium]
MAHEHESLIAHITATPQTELTFQAITVGDTSTMIVADRTCFSVGFVVAGEDQCNMTYRLTDREGEKPWDLDVLNQRSSMIATRATLRGEGVIGLDPGVVGETRETLGPDGEPIAVAALSHSEVVLGIAAIGHFEVVNLPEPTL